MSVIGGVSPPNINPDVFALPPLPACFLVPGNEGLVDQAVPSYPAHVDTSGSPPPLIAEV